MWRIFQNFPRGFRQTWNSYVRSTPQTVHQNEREDENLQHGSLHGYFLPRTASIPKPIAYSHDNSSSAAGDVSFGRDWQEWRRAYKNGQSQKAFEALGLGTFVVLSLQLTRLFTAVHEQEKQKQQSLRFHPYCPLLQVACHHILQPTAPSHKLTETDLTEKQDSNELEEIQDGHELTQIEDLEDVTDAVPIEKYDCSSLEETTANCSQTPKTEEAVAGDIESVWREYEALADVYNSISDHLQGLHHAQAGQFDQAVKCWTMASDAGYPKAQFNLALCYETGTGINTDLKQAVELYQKAADAGHTQALYNLAVLYMQGAGGLPPDQHHATTLLQQAAGHGFTKAQVCLGILFMKEGEDFEKAAKWFESASQNEDAHGMFYLGQCYEHGLGVPQNECKAADLYAQAAKKGHVKAMHNLAACFENGLGGLPEDKKMALNLYQQAAGAGDEESQQHLRFLQEELHAAQSSHADSINLKNRRKPALRTLHTSVSMPAFTDYIRQHLYKFTFTANNMLEFAFTNPNNEATCSVIDSESTLSTPTFYISEDTDDDMFVNESLQSNTFNSCALSQTLSGGGLNRSASFNDARILLVNY